ncbi:MAG: hypothetical protein HY301_16740 [Verrucomicrobia bacterium]|nr:hypothetical protein [Verrucomicrobiota bacterium]
MKNLARILFVSFVAFGSVSARADVKLPPVISDHMVLQHDVAAPIWGTAAPGEAVTVSIAGQTKTATADAKGNWKVTLDPLKIAEGLTLTVKGKNTITITDVLVGEVWLGSGQSNMDMHVASYTAGDNVLSNAANATYPKLRLLHRGRKGWELAVPTNNVQFSALLFAFGFRLQQELTVPVGIMVGAVGGTPSGYWLTEEMYRSDAACQAQATEFAAKYDFDAAMKKYDEQLAEWKVAAEKAKAEKGKAPRSPTKPAKAGESSGRIGNLYEAHVRPYAPYAIRGVLWDQGESGTAITGVDQFNVIGALIKGWRKEWGQDFPFLYVQKTSGGGCAFADNDPVTKHASKFSPLPKAVPGNTDGLYRELHLKIQQHPKTAMVTSTDLGSGTHPVSKSAYGERAARVALGFVYGKSVETSGPLYASHAIEGGKVRIKFTHAGQRLAARHSDKLQGFMIAGADKKFVWADAVIEGNSVIVSSAEVTKPAAVRYAWSGNAPWANLFNQDGLPAQTFRTDDWK